MIWPNVRSTKLPLAPIVAKCFVTPIWPCQGGGAPHPRAPQALACEGSCHLGGWCSGLRDQVLRWRWSWKSHVIRFFCQHSVYIYIFGYPQQKQKNLELSNYFQVWNLCHVFRRHLLRRQERSYVRRDHREELPAGRTHDWWGRFDGAPSRVGWQLARNKCFVFVILLLNGFLFYIFAWHCLCQSGSGPIQAPTDLVWNRYDILWHELFVSIFRPNIVIDSSISESSFIDWFQTSSLLKWLNRQVRPNLFGLGSAAEDLLHQRCCPWEFCGIVRGGVCPKGGTWLKKVGDAIMNTMNSELQSTSYQLSPSGLQSTTIAHRSHRTLAFWSFLKAMDSVLVVPPGCREFLQSSSGRHRGVQEWHDLSFQRWQFS